MDSSTVKSAEDSKKHMTLKSASSRSVSFWPTSCSNLRTSWAKTWDSTCFARACEGGTLTFAPLDTRSWNLSRTSWSASKCWILDRDLSSWVSNSSRDSFNRLDCCSPPRSPEWSKKKQTKVSCWLLKTCTCSQRKSSCCSEKPRPFSARKFSRLRFMLWNMYRISRIARF